MKILGLDSATGGCSVAVVDGRTVLARRDAVQERGQAEILMPMVEAVLGEAGLGYADLDRFAVTVGPGSFTGLRIGLAAARGLALAARRPLIGIDTFEAVAHGVPEDERRGRTVVVVIDSRRAEVFARTFGADLKPLGAPVVALPEALGLPQGPFVVAGDGMPFLEPILSGRRDASFARGSARPDATVVARLAAERPIPESPPGPLYLRAPDVTPPRTGR